MTWDRKAPWTEDGKLINYAGGYFSRPVIWRDIEEFEATLSYVKIVRGCSAAHMIFTDDDGDDYPVFLADLVHMFDHFKCGAVYGLWIPCKRGQNFGVKLVRAF